MQKNYFWCRIKFKQMKFLELVQQRFSARKYRSAAVDRSVVERCLEAAGLAPSASNSQPWHFVVCDDPELKDKVAAQTWNRVLSFNKFAQQAPVIVAFVLEKPKVITQIGGHIKNKEYPLIDIGIAAEHFCLQAHEEGLGTCMLGWFNEQAVKKLLNVPNTKSIALLITLGYHDYQNLPAKKRNSLTQMMSYNGYIR